MWETTVVVERSQLVDGPQDRVFSLLADPAVWSLEPDHFAFEVPAPPGSGRLYCWAGAHGDHLGGSVLTVREEAPGQAISFRTPVPPVPQGELVFTLSAMPEGARVKVTITVRQTVLRGSKSHTSAYWPRRLKAWLNEIRAAVEGRRPWPGTGIPPDVSQRLAGTWELKNPVTTAVAGLIVAPAEQVWESIYASGTLSVALSHLLTPVAAGTRVELTWRLPARVPKRNRREDVMHSSATVLQAILDAYKAVIEESPGGR